MQEFSFIFHSMTSSAIATSDGGTEIPSKRAVLRLIAPAIAVVEARSVAHQAVGGGAAPDRRLPGSRMQIMDASDDD